MSTRTRLILGALLILAVLASLFEVSIPSRPVRGIEAIAELPERGDLNVVFILVDMLRADRLSAYGYERETTPQLDLVMQSAVRFANAEAQSTWTKTSMASLWTGVLPPQTGIVRYPHAVPDDVKMPAEIFKEAGYTTAGLWRNGWVASNFGFQQGFDRYLRPTPRKTTADELERRTPGTRKLAGTDADVTEGAIQFLRTYRDDKFMLYLHYMDVHQYAYDTEAAALNFGSSLSDAYDASIHWTDRNVGAVIGELEALDVLDRTIVVIGSDHGEAFREHTFEGHARDLYRETTDVPLMMILPFRLDEGLVVDSLVRNVDIWPTILEMTGLPPLETTDGVSLVPTMLAAARGEMAETPASVAYLDQTWGQVEKDPSPLIAIRKQDKRIIYKPEDRDRTLQIFDHATDPGEQRNLRADPPAWAAPLEQELADSHGRAPVFGDSEEIELDELYLQQLRALGYVVE